MMGAMRPFAKASLMMLLAAALPGAALARACTADRGERLQHQVALKAWEIEELARLTPSTPARLFLTDCGMDCVRGIDDPQEDYEVRITVSQERVTFALSDAGGRARGGLVFAMPETYTYFAADTDPAGAATHRRLYNELRLTGTVGGSGDFAAAGPAAAELVFSGFGGGCVLARAFQTWTLSVSGDGAAFRLFGGLAR